MKRLTKVAAATSLIFGLAVSGMAQATPYFEIVGGAQETQNFAGVQIIPNTANGYDSQPRTEVGGAAMGLYLRDATVASGTLETLRFDYIGSDASFTNQFLFADAGINWCNKANALCGTTPANNNQWSGPYGATAFVTVATDALIPFSFGSLSSNTLFKNGDSGSVNNGHLFYASIDGGSLADGFYDSTNPRNGKVIALGFTDGNAGNVGDDDHQDLMVKVSAVPEPESYAMMLAGLALMGTVARRSGTKQA